METKNLIEIKAKDVKKGDIIHISPWYKIPVFSDPYLNDYGYLLVDCDSNGKSVYSLEPTETYLTVERKL
jgi:hypothetical protein